VPDYRVEALVLSSSPLGETDRLVNLLSRRRGKIRAVARGSQKTTSRLAGLIQPLNHVRLLLWEGRSLDGIKGGDLLKDYHSLRSDWSTLSYGSCMVELVDCVSGEGEPDEPLYLLLLTSFEALASGMAADLVGLFFFVRVLKVAGFFPRLEACVECGCSPDGQAYLDHARGGVLCQDCAGRSSADGHEIAGDQRRLLAVLRDIHPERLDRVRVKGQALTALRDIMLDYAEYHLDRKLNSRRFLDILD